MPTLLCPTLARALAAPVETTLRAVLDEYGWDCGDNILLSLQRLADALSYFELSSSPPVGTGGLDDSRVLSSVASGSVTAALQEIARGETETVEFKSTLLLDLRRFRGSPGDPISSYRLEKLVTSTLKTIAALSNSSGGTLYIGVEDNGNICGLTEDFALANQTSPDYDHWNLFLRAQVETRFYEGRAVNSAFRTVLLEHQDRPFVQIQVAARRELSFLKRLGAANVCDLYIRSGTRSVPIEFQDIQKHFDVHRRA